MKKLPKQFGISIEVFGQDLYVKGIYFIDSTPIKDLEITNVYLDMQGQPEITELLSEIELYFLENSSPVCIEGEDGLFPKATLWELLEKQLLKKLNNN